MAERCSRDETEKGEREFLFALRKFLFLKKSHGLKSQTQQYEYLFILKVASPLPLHCSALLHHPLHGCLALHSELLHLSMPQQPFLSLFFRQDLFRWKFFLESPDRKHEKKLQRWWVQGVVLPLLHLPFCRKKPQFVTDWEQFTTTQKRTELEQLHNPKPSPTIN